MSLNVELLQETLRYVEEHPDQHDQATWRNICANNICGTTMCFAGWAATLAGGTWYLGTDLLLAEPADDPDRPFKHRYFDLRVISVRKRATRLLGLTRDQAEELFYNCGDVDDLRHSIKQMIEDHEIALEKSR